MSEAPRSPGWYPAPDGRGQQWFNGVSWSETRRGLQDAAAAANIPIPLSWNGQHVASASNPYAGQNPAAISASITGVTSRTLSLVALVVGIGAFFVPLAGPVAVGLGASALRREPAGRPLAIFGIVLGIVGTIVGAFWLFLFVWLGVSTS